jgi:hypothetical protein
MEAALLLQLAYAANIAILAPVIAGLVGLGARGTAAVIGGGIPESAGLRLLVASLWGAILVLSVAGLFHPLAFWPILLLQVVYKAAWLAGYVLPAWRRGGPAAVPSGPAVCFAAIVVIWPVLLVVAWRFQAP